jgi:NTE family protein
MCVVWLALTISACANLTAVDKPLSHWTPEMNRRLGERIAGDRSPELLVLVAFSGGGTRAATFSYGVLKALAATEITTENGQRSILHEIDVISSVSGGSFTSAYYGLYGDRIFEDFEDHFLRKNVEFAIIGQVFNPINWVRLLSSSYGKSDLAARYYDKILFDNATFADLHRPGAPLVVINTTDLATGVRFPFNQWMFDLICADLDQYPVSRAVAASSAVPIVLSPITLKSFAGSCGYEPPAWLDEAKNDDEITYRKLEARDLENYLDLKKRPWLHLVDGGIADNLGLRSFYNSARLIDDPHLAFDEFGHPDVRQILIISVNSRARKEPDWALERAAPSLAQIIGSTSSDQIDRYSVDTLDLVQSAYKKWTEQVSTAEHPVSFNFIEVSFELVKDDAERDSLNNIGTNFDLNDEQVDHLISAADQVLRESREFKEFLERNNGSGDKKQETLGPKSPF